MKGYVNFTLATSPYQGWGEVGKTECRYRAFRDHEGSFTPSHYKILGLKLAFVIIFEVSTNTVVKHYCVYYLFNFISLYYRVSHSEDCKVNQLWGVEESIILLVYGAFCKFFIMSTDYDKKLSDWSHDCTDHKSLVKWPEKLSKKAI